MRPFIGKLLCLRKEKAMQPKEWNRKSRECSFSQLHPDLIQIILDKAAEAELGRIDADILFCCETESEKIKKGLFSSAPGMKDKHIHQAAVVTPDWLILATKGDKSSAWANFYYYDKMEVNSYRPMLIDDCGLEIMAQGRGMVQRGMFFVGFGDEMTAHRLKEALKAVIARKG
jgi:hypothetical protein